MMDIKLQTKIQQQQQQQLNQEEQQQPKEPQEQQEQQSQPQQEQPPKQQHQSHQLNQKEKQHDQPQQQKQHQPTQKTNVCISNKKETCSDQTAIMKNEDFESVSAWKVEDVLYWIEKHNKSVSNLLVECIRAEGIDGQVLLALTEEDIRDMRYRLNYKLTFGEMKKFWIIVFQLQLKLRKINGAYGIGVNITQGQYAQIHDSSRLVPVPCSCTADCPSDVTNCDEYLKDRKRIIQPEYFKTAISLGYSFLVTWITSFVMVIVHERVPDMKRYPPLPDIFLDNVPHIPWAFHMCEITGTLLFSIWLVVIIFHRYRTVLLRRFFALAGTVFLLRCVTMLITSLSVPGTHLQCNQRDFAVDDPNLDTFDCLCIRISRAYTIWSGLGMSIQGVRTCGDYMFSGHTVALTLMNFFITEYTPRHLYFLHTLSWLLNMFGIFFILAAHEHYSIDVFVAFYITSRLFLYYHTLANNQSLKQRDSVRTRIWFPMFSYFESSVDGIIPNEFNTPSEIFNGFLYVLTLLKDAIMMTAHRIWLDPPFSNNKNNNSLTNGTTNYASLNNSNTEIDRSIRPAYFSLSSLIPSCVAYINIATSQPQMQQPQVQQECDQQEHIQQTQSQNSNANRNQQHYNQCCVDGTDCLHKQRSVITTKTVKTQTTAPIDTENKKQL